MLIRALTKKRQRKSVQYFMKYVIDHHEVKEEALAVHSMTAEQLIDGFDPLNDQVDRRILYEITGRKLNQEDYWDDSDQDPDNDPHNQDPTKVSDLATEYQALTVGNESELRRLSTQSLIDPNNFKLN